MIKVNIPATSTPNVSMILGTSLQQQQAASVPHHLSQVH